MHGIASIAALPDVVTFRARFHTVEPPSSENSNRKIVDADVPARFAMPISVTYDVDPGEVPPDVHDDHVFAAVEWVSDAEVRVCVDDCPCTVWAGEVKETAAHAEPVHTSAFVAWEASARVMCLPTYGEVSAALRAAAVA